MLSLNGIVHPSKMASMKAQIIARRVHGKTRVCRRFEVCCTTLIPSRFSYTFIAFANMSTSETLQRAAESEQTVDLIIMK